jgi:hypothetical protein
MGPAALTSPAGSEPTMNASAHTFGPTTVNGDTVHAPNADFRDDTERKLLSRTVRRLLALGYEVEGVYYGDHADRDGWTKWDGPSVGARRYRVHLIDIARNGEALGTVKVVEVADTLSARDERDENGRNPRIVRTVKVYSRVEAEPALLRTLRG